jgi:hypothetical protein
MEQVWSNIKKAADSEGICKRRFNLCLLSDMFSMDDAIFNQ